jgi:hypothetical protein
VLRFLREWESGDDLIRMPVPSPYADDVPVPGNALARPQTGNIC